MKISEITLEIQDKQIKLYTLGDMVVVVLDNGGVLGYRDDGQYWNMGWRILDSAGVEQPQLAELDTLSEVLAVLVDGKVA